MIRCTSLMTGASPSSRVLVVDGLAAGSRPSSAKSMAVSVNSWSIESTDSVSVDGAAIILIDRLDDRFLGRQRDLDLPIEHEPQLVDRLEVHRIMHDHTDDPTLLREGHDDVFAGERFGNELDDRGGDLDLAELDERQAVLFGLGLHDVVGVGVAQLDEGVLDGALPCGRLP